MELIKFQKIKEQKQIPYIQYFRFFNKFNLIFYNLLLIKEFTLHQTFQNFQIYLINKEINHEIITINSESNSSIKFTFPELPSGFYNIILKVKSKGYATIDENVDTIFKNLLTFDSINPISGSF